MLKNLTGNGHRRKEANTTDKKTQTEIRKELLQARHRAEEAQARNRVKERNARTRRLIQEGAVLESIFPEFQTMEPSQIRQELLNRFKRI